MTEVEGVRPVSDVNLVPWQHLSHAYGSATDVPGMIHALNQATTKEEAGAAEHRLWCAVLHQGQAYTATGSALPFILGMLRDRADLRPSLIGWLWDLSWVFDDRAYAANPRAVECRAVLTAAVPDLTPLLDDDEPETRSAVTGIYGKITQAAAFAWPQLNRRWPNETDPGVQADMLISLAALAAEAGTVREALELTEPWWTSPDLTRRVAAAHARMLLDPRDDQARDLLTASMTAGAKLGSWWRSGWADSILQTLGRSEAGLLDPKVLPAALEAIASINHYLGGELLAQVLAAAFPAGANDVPRLAADLTPVQRQIIEMLASGRIAYTSPLPGVLGGATLVHGTRGPLTSWRLPDSVPRLRQWLAGHDRIWCVSRRARKQVLRDAKR